MFRHLFIAGICLANLSLAGQTKLIAHKSHTGSIETFRLAYRTASAELEGSNFGQAPQEIVRTAALDSLIFISDSLAIMVTSKFCERRYSGESKLWRAGRDTVRNHPLFSKQHALDSIKQVLQGRYHFRNPVEGIKFIGYDNRKDSLDKKDSLGCPDIRYVSVHSSEWNQQPSSGHGSFIMIGIIAFSILSGGLSWMVSKHKI